MDEPVRGRLRPARRRGLTSPDPVTAPARPPRPPVPVRQPDTRTSRRTGQRRENHGRKTTKIINPPAGTRTRTPRQASEFRRWIEAKPVKHARGAGGATVWLVSRGALVAG